MTDELKDIEQQAAERRKYSLGGRFAFPALEQAEADLDRAIAIARNERAAKERVRRGVERAMKGQNTG